VDDVEIHSGIEQLVLRGVGRDPGAARVRDPDVVERYEQ
jgi:hypothetical protein